MPYCNNIFQIFMTNKCNMQHLSFMKMYSKKRFECISKVISVHFSNRDCINSYLSHRIIDSIPQILK